jgi:hypothetical protein
MSMNEQISEAVSIFRASPNLDDKEIYEILVVKGFKRQLAARLVEFLPMAYGRFLLAKAGVRFSDAYQRMLPGCLRSVPFRLNLFGQWLWRLLVLSLSAAYQ